MLNFFCVLVAVYLTSNEVDGHGYMLVPPNRASLWRIDWTQPPNYNDNEYFCGGTHVHYDINGGKCGVCGDDWRDPVPRSNENGGSFGNGIVTVNYTQGDVIVVRSMITANHLGSLYFHICALTDPSQPETDECFRPLYVADGTNNFPIGPLVINGVDTQVQLPKDLVCDRCVLRWHYRTGNSWGMCQDGTQSLGCGHQEVFRSCADIRILPRDDPGDDDDDDDEGDDDKPTTPAEPEDDSSEEEPPSSDELIPCYLPPKPHHPHRNNNEELKRRL